MPPALPQTTSSTLKGAIQLGIGYTVGNLSSKPERDVLMQDFYVVESIFFPRYALVPQWHPSRLDPECTVTSKEEAPMVSAPLVSPWPKLMP